MRYQLYCQKREQGMKKLFLAKDSFLPSLQEINRHCVEMAQIPLVVLSNDAYNRDEFAEMQLHNRNNANQGL